jgi:hypothetical protein
MEFSEVGKVLNKVQSLALVCTLMAAPSVVVHAEEGEPPKYFNLSDEVVCRINTEAVSKRQVEEQMAEVGLRLAAFRHEQEKNGLWNDETEKKWNEMYIPEFRNALRDVVRERMMLQHFKADAHMSVDEHAYEKRVNETVSRLKHAGVFGGKGYSMGEVRKRVLEKMQIDTFRYRFQDALVQPSRPEVNKYYQENINRYQRKAGAKVRLIRIDRFVKNKLTGRQQVRENAYEEAVRLREDIEKWGAKFEEVARQHNNDEALKASGGLIIVDPKDPYFDPETYSPQLANALRGLKLNEVSKVFEYLQTSWAFAMVEDVREAGPAPLDGQLYDEIYRTLMGQKSRKNEDDWFRKALSKSLVVHVVDAVPKTLPVEFFFPDEKPPEKEAPKAGSAGKAESEVVTKNRK